MNRQAFGNPMVNNRLHGFRFRQHSFEAWIHSKPQPAVWAWEQVMVNIWNRAWAFPSFCIACDVFLSSSSGLLPHTRLCSFGLTIYVVKWTQ